MRLQNRLTVVPTLIGLCAVSLFVSATLAQETGAPAATPPAKPAQAADAPPPAAPADPVAQADALMKKRGLKNYQSAADMYEKALAQKPNDIDLMLKAATALNAVMRTKTHGNIILLNGKTVDTKKNRAFWKDYGGRSVALLDKVRKQRKNDINVEIQYAEAFMYQSAAYGIIEAISKGSADTYKDNAKRLNKLSTKADGAVGHIYLGGFYLVAPWPLSDDDTSREHYDKAVALQPKSTRNNYYAGLRAYLDEDWSKAEKHFKAAAENRCYLSSEIDFCGRLKREAKKGLAEVAKKR